MACTNITLNAAAYERLKNMKRPGQSFSDVVLQYLAPPADTCGELLDRLEKAPPPAGLNLERLDEHLKQRGKRSKRDR
jgi:hypothetical protein